MMEIDLDKLEALARAATPGPWISEIAKTRSRGWVSMGELRSADATCLGHRCEANAIFIAAADPTTVLALIERVRQAEASASRGWSIADEMHITVGQLRSEAKESEKAARIEGLKADVVLRNLQSQIDAIVNRERHDIERYGEWRCDYEQWRIELQQLFDARIRELGGEP